MTRDAAEIQNLSLEDVRAGLQDGSILLVDVREPSEFQAGAIPGSVSMPLSQFKPAALPEDRGQIVFSCAAGVRSLRAIELARAAGLDVNAHYPGGFKEWVRSGQAVA